MEPVWIIPERCWGYIKQKNTYYSIVIYSDGGFEYEELFENFELIECHELGIEYEN